MQKLLINICEIIRNNPFIKLIDKLNEYVQKIFKNSKYRIEALIKYEISDFFISGNKNFYLS